MPLLETHAHLPEGCVELPDVSWEFYEQFLDEFHGRRIKHVYCDGELAIMSPIFAPHEILKKRLARMVEPITEELKRPVLSTGSLTLRSPTLRQGAEPDESYFLTHADVVRQLTQYNSETDPPPDLVIEVDITSFSDRRLQVYAALGVPEVWIAGDRPFRIEILDDNGTYQESITSRELSGVTVDTIRDWLSRAETVDETTWITAFREWIRSNLTE